MRHIVALPDYNQSGSISAWTETGTKSLKQALSESGVELAMLPPSFVIGIPEPLLRERVETDFVLSQVVRLDHAIIMSTSCQAGLDKTGRHVFLTELSVEDSVNAGIRELSNFYRVIPVGLSEELTDLIVKMRKAALGDLRTLLEVALRRPRDRHLSSRSMTGMHYQPDWPKKKVSGGRLSVKEWLVLLTTVPVLAALIYEYLQ